MSQDRNHALLAEMGITQWTLTHPERLGGYEQTPLDLEDDIKLLFVAQQTPSGSNAEFMQKVLQGAMKLSLDSCRHITPAQFSQLSKHNLEWVWFCGCEPMQTEVSKTLKSPALSEIDGHNQNRRALWEQIKSYG
ncbi:DNA polymerase III subunit psi [Vibrio ishigakensis]|nr:DNA polymerase III subunit psi [Vibrio ishigakensis]